MLPLQEDASIGLSHPCHGMPQAMLNMAAGWSRRRPILLACTSTTVKTVAADLLVQKVVERRDSLDTKRTLAFAIFGCSWMGAGQYFVYCRLLEWLLPARTIAATLGKVSLDQFVHVPFVFMPIFYCVDAAVQGESASYAKHKFETEIVETMKANWALWLPAQFIGFRFVPSHVRVPYVACVSFVWTSILSMLQGKFRAASEGSIAHDA